MKNLLLILITLTFSMGLATAQTPEKDMKKAGKLLGSYNLDPANRGDKLDEAKTLIDAAMATEEMSASSRGWNTKGDIYTQQKKLPKLHLIPISHLLTQHLSL